MFAAENLYDCTDSAGIPDFLLPGDWVHAFGGHSATSVLHVVHGRSMSEPDTIKEGWSVAGLWGLWHSFVGLSIAVSVFLARKRWIAPYMMPRPFKWNS
ncbi:MAG TPA: hypothetical protein VGO59_08685 [Verrucomicrobiae bacterium]|jgi:hypothetical protein